MKKLFFYCALLLCGGSVLAGGYRVVLQGVRQSAMGNTSAVHTHDASVAFFNPAGLAFVEGKFNIAAGVYAVNANAQYQNPATGQSFETDNGVGTPFYFAASYKPTKDLALGVSVTTPFGSNVSWPNDWSGNNLITEIELRAIFIQPTVAYRFADWFSMGAGFIYSTGSVNLQRTVTVGNNDILLELDDTDAVGLGYNLGFYFKPDEKLNIGLAYRSNVDIEANDGETVWRNLPASLGTTAPFYANEFGAELPLPAEFIVGLSYQVLPKLLISGEMSLTEWSEYENLTIDFINENPPTGQPSSVSSVSGRNYEDRVIWRAGAEYNATDKLDIRAGYYYDPYPSPSEFWSPETPSVTQHAFTGGIGYKFANGFNVDIYGHYLYGEERSINNIETNFAGDVRSNTFIGGLGLSYSFGSFGNSDQ